MAKKLYGLYTFKTSAVTNCYNFFCEGFLYSCSFILRHSSYFWWCNKRLMDDNVGIDCFSRFAKERICATICRATFAISRLKKTVPAAAWKQQMKNNAYHVLKQVINNCTSKHLKREEYICRQFNTILDIESLINVVSLYEVAHDLIPNTTLKHHEHFHWMLLL